MEKNKVSDNKKNNPPLSTNQAVDEAQSLEQAWSVVEKSRHPERPYTLDYIENLFVDFEELKGDRSFGNDPAIIGGIAELRGQSNHSSKKVFILGHQKGRKTKQKVMRNFGMARPEGYRKAIRMMELAERFNKPLITFIDTPGAFPGIEAEARGQSEAIASSVMKMLHTKVPTLSLVIGEGGSGGALGIGTPDVLLMLENSTYSVISPESCAAILWSDASESKKAARSLKLTAQNVHELGICDEIIPEPAQGAHVDFPGLCKKVSARFHSHLEELSKMGLEERQAKRFEKYRRIDSKKFQPK